MRFGLSGFRTSTAPDMIGSFPRSSNRQGATRQTWPRLANS
jgi:hypothetical protein